MVKEISKKEFESRFPSVSTYGLENYNPVYLDCGEVLCETEWNGERYESKGNEYFPVYEKESNEILGYEVR